MSPPHVSPPSVPGPAWPAARPQGCRSASLRLLLLLLATLGSTPWTQGETSPWQTLDGCTFVAHAHHDGDSFHVQHQGRDLICRLYFVDTPETDLSYPDRVADQQKAFHDLGRDNVLLLGAEARNHTADLLGAAPFRIVTAFEKAPGQSAGQRYWALVFVGRTNLAIDLVRLGLARVHGRPAAWPDAAGGERLRQQLRVAAEQAQRAQRGAWNPRFRSSATPSHGARPDLNRASAAELARLPGIGDTLARRIIAARPFSSFEDLDRRVSGIGSAKIESLRTTADIRPPPPKPRPTKRRP